LHNAGLPERFISSGGLGPSTSYNPIAVTLGIDLPNAMPITSTVAQVTIRPAEYAEQTLGTANGAAFSFTQDRAF
jgi:hypothetical protein